MNHTVKTLAIFCSDFRQNQILISELKKKHGQFDLLVFPGGGCLPALMEDSKKPVISWIKTLYQLHGFKKIVLIDHTDCGAYKLTYGEKVHDPKQEELLHVKNAERLTKFMGKDKDLKNLAISCFIYDLKQKKLRKLRVAVF